MSGFSGLFIFISIKTMIYKNVFGWMLFDKNVEPWRELPLTFLLKSLR